MSDPVQITIPKAFQELFNPHRYKVYYGGRGGAKSHNFARAIIIKMMQQPTRVLCARELQNSISDSVHRLFSDIIEQYGLKGFFTVQNAVIKSKNGGEIIFKGLRHNSTEIKSTEGVDVCWVEEAEKVSDLSWESLIPTIRKPSSEIWISFNTKSVNDPTYQRFVARQSPDVYVRKVSWEDNPFFPEVLNKERLRLRSDDLEAYQHVWEGEPDTRRSGSVYAALIDKARAGGRVIPINYKPGVPVTAAWDLGKKHATCIWFAQVVGREVRIFDYHEATGNDADIEKLARVVLDKDYLYECNWLPHDGKHERLGMKGSISDQLKAAGVKNKILPSLSIEAGISKAKNLLKEAYVDSEKTKQGLHALEHYHYEYDENRQCFKASPYDDWSADAADALRYLAIALDKRVEVSQAQARSITKPVEWSVF